MFGVCVCVEVGVRCLVHLCVSAYCQPCRYGDDIMAHDHQLMERIPSVLTDGGRGGEIEQPMEAVDGGVKRRRRVGTILTENIETS